MIGWKSWLGGITLWLVATAGLAQSSNPISYMQPNGSMRNALNMDAARLLASPPKTLEGESDLACMAVAVYHESRGEPIKGQRAVASVVLQRTLVPERWGRTACEVVRPVQFTFMTGRWTYAPIRVQAAWETALRVALTVTLQGPDADLMGSDHYHTHTVYPDWRNAMDMVAMIGNHRFYVDPISVRKVAEAGIGTGGSTTLVAFHSGQYDWTGEGVPTYTTGPVGDGVRGLDNNAVQDLYKNGWAEQKVAAQVPQTGGFSPLRGPDVEAIARATTGIGLAPSYVSNTAVPGKNLGLTISSQIEVAQNGFRPLGIGSAQK